MIQQRKATEAAKAQLASIPHRPILVVEPTHLSPADGAARYSLFRYRGDVLQHRLDDLTEIEVNEAIRTFTQAVRKDLETVTQNRQVLIKVTRTAAEVHA